MGDRTDRLWHLPFSRAYLIVGKAATIRWISGSEKYGESGNVQTYGRVGDLSTRGGDIEVDANQNAFCVEIEVSDREFV